MKVEELTIGEAREIARLFNSGVAAAPHPFKVGAVYFIRTVTHHHTGRLVEVTPTELVLEDAAWIADDGRFAESLKNCEFAEVEPFPDGRVIVGRGALVDAVEIKEVQRSQK